MDVLQTLYRSDPQRAWPLLRGAMAQLQQQLFAMKRFASPEEVRPLQKAFVLLAGQVYRGMDGQELSEQDRYLIRQGWAEALLIDGKPAEARVLFQSCQAEDLDRRKMREEELQREVAGHLAQLGSGTISRAYLPYRYRGFQEALQKAGLHEEALAEAADLKRSWDYWKQDESDERAAVVSDCLRAAWKALERWQIAHLPMDGSNGLGLARVAQAMGDYPQALEYYRNLVRGIDAHELPEFYWKVQLERVGCLRESLSQGGDRSQMEILLRQLRLQDNSMGGFSEEFERMGAFDGPESR
jgi:tetratricopeptide (TPR) repeat protein